MPRTRAAGLIAALVATTVACAAPPAELPTRADGTAAPAPAPAPASDPRVETRPPGPPTSRPADRPPETVTASTSAPPDPSTSTTTPLPSTRRISMAFTGDILPHSPLWRQAARNTAAAGLEGYDFRPMLANLAPVLASVDLAVCHLETPIAPDGEEYSTMPRFGVPAEVVDAIAHAGYDRCSTASNHAADRGGSGIDRTVDVLEAHGISQSGMARTPAEIAPTVIDVAGVAVGHLSYTWSYNGLSLPDGEEWRSALIDPDRILADVDAARAMGAEVVVVSLHWGTEKSSRPDRYQLDVAEALTAPGTIDLIVGHHAHVLQPIEQVNGTWVIYGLGNVLSNMPTSFRWPDASQDAAVVAVDIDVDPDGTVSVGRPRAYPTWVDKDAGWIVLVVQEELARADISAGHRGRLERSLERTLSVLGDAVVGG